MELKKYIHISCFFFLSLFISSFPLMAQDESPDGKIIFEAMQDALTENMSKLKIDKLKSPFYIDYTITNAYTINVESSLGGIIKSKEKPVNNSTVQVCIGDYQQNNLNFYTENNMYGWASNSSFYIPMPMKPDYNAIKRNLWINTDAAYKSAAEQMETKMGSISQQNIPKEELRVPDLSKIPVQTQYISTQTAQNFSKQQLETLTNELSLVFNEYPYFTSSGVSAYLYHADIYYLNSEGIQYKQPFTISCLRIYAQTVANDGEPLADYLNFYFTDNKQLPNTDSLKNAIHKMSTLLNQLRTTPVISEMYSGPVLFEGDAVGEIVSQCFVDNSNGLLAIRKPFSSNPSMLQYIISENNLESLIGKKIISRDLSITALDGLKEYNSIPLIGHYELDAEGVNVNNETSLIKDGVLQTLLNDRIPTLKIQASNGHKRFSISNGYLSKNICSGVIELKSTKNVSASKLKKQLIALGKEEDLEYVYIIKKIANPMTDVPGLYKYFSRENQDISNPIYAYKVSVKDGSETLVRMTKVSGLSLKAFKRIAGISDKQHVYNTMQRGVKKRYYNNYYSDFGLKGTPCSFIVPEGILFQELEIEKDKNVILKKEPIVTNPLLSEENSK